ncbi:unnamed protein product [Owenia fusiformis]|uniref:Uncharacterized protein n=1 Tax=Owenia fusiformis TaxID=6347 RepID=A0A8J1U859_OWEFU|nr:unnamed protein product [Owenia fusiformis]
MSDTAHNNKNNNVDRDAIHEAAVSMAEKYGDEHRYIIEPYDILAKCWANDKQVSEGGLTVVIERSIFDRIRIMGEVLQAIKDDPKILEVPITKPIFIIGYMRTGSTLLHNIIEKDVNHFVPPLWQLAEPLPIPDGKEKSDDPRILGVKNFSEHYNQIPGWLQKHQAFTPYALEECSGQLGKTGCMKELLLGGQNIEEYTQWYEQLKDEWKVSMYEYYKKELQLLAYKQGFGSRTYVRKDAQHMANMPALLRVFPGARTVNSIRNPIQTIGSICSMSYTVNQAYYTPDNLDLEAMGKRILRNADHIINTYMDYREATDGPDKSSANVVDVYYNDLVGDPKGTLEKIYTKFNIELTQETLDNVQHYLEENQQNKHGKHVYDISTYGLTEDEIKRVFKRYIEYFNVDCN